MELFEFFKNNGDLNKNKFLNLLIVNFFDFYNEKNATDFKSISEMLSTYIEDEKDKIYVTSMITKYINEFGLYTDDGKYDSVISLKPTAASAPTIAYIQANCLNGINMSNYFRNMFFSYTVLPQDKRELIIFKEKYDTVTRAIEREKTVFFTTYNGNDCLLKPYAIKRAKQEMFNYVIGQVDDKPMSFRLSKMQNVKVADAREPFTDEMISNFERIIENGPQYAFAGSHETCVELTDEGISLFKRIYTNRPKPTKIEGNRYYFTCSDSQLYFYFNRFGSEALVLYPDTLKEKLEQYYSSASKRYSVK